MGKYEDAIREYTSAINSEQSKGRINVSFYKNCAQCYFDMGQFDDAVQCLETASQENDSDPQVLYKLGLTFFAS
jgi:tetratricopeptide (TPR) repeat protein